MPVFSSIGLAFGIAGFLNLTNDLIGRWKTVFRAMRDAEVDGEAMLIRFDHLSQRQESLQNVLFLEGKFDFVQGRIFDHLLADQQHVLACMFRELARLLYRFLKLGKDRNLSHLQTAPLKNAFDITLTPDQLLELFIESDFVPRHGDPSLQLSWTGFAWAVSNKAHVEEFLNRYEAWIKRIRETMEDFWWPLSFFDKFSNMQALEVDKDFEGSGMVEHSRLRKLVLDDSLFRETLELKNSQATLEPKQQATVMLRRKANMGNRAVFIETMPHKVDTDGFMPAELRRRFCMIATLLNAQNIDELRVLRCIHWAEVKEYDGTKTSSMFQLISELPAHDSSDFTSLDEVIRLRRTPRKPSLDARFRICHVVGQTLSECFKIGWRHRSVRSSNVLFFMDQTHVTSNHPLVDPFVCGFEASRLHDDYSMEGHGDNSIRNNVYRHPDRWGTPKAEFDLYHDLYAFGVIMLEVGLWEPVLQVLGRYSGKQTVSKLNAADVKHALLDACKSEIGHRCGNRYARMIEMCLSSNLGIDKGTDTNLQTRAQAVFREEILEQLVNAQKTLSF